MAVAFLPLSSFIVFLAFGLSLKQSLDCTLSLSALGIFLRFCGVSLFLPQVFLGLAAPLRVLRPSSDSSVVSFQLLGEGAPLRGAERSR